MPQMQHAINIFLSLLETQVPTNNTTLHKIIM